MRFFYIIAYIILWIPCHVLYPIFVTGRDNIPQGACIFCANHSCYVDPVLLIYACGLSHFLRCMSKKENMEKPFLGWFMRMCGAYAVSRGEQDITAVRTTLRLLRSGNKIVIFPEGTRTQTDDINSGKTGAVRFAAKTNVPIVPVFITRNKGLFRPIRVRIGEPYHPDCSVQEEYVAEARVLMERIFALGESYVH